MANFKIRPRFSRKTRLPISEITTRIKSALEDENASIIGYVMDHHIFLKIPVKDRHYWSPELHLEIEELESSSLIKGILGPRPSVWFMYVFFYSFLGFISVIVMIVGFSQLNLGLPGRILWVLPILLVLFLFAFFTAKAGQKLGHDEMHALYDFAEEAIDVEWERV